MRKTLFCLLLVLLTSAPAAHARIKLITLPVRERVEIQLDHQTATLVEEERIVPLIKGVNQVDFSWANTSIDPDTIVFRVTGGEGNADVKVLSVSYPPNEAALVWAVSSSASGSARVRISYLIGRLDKQFAYRAVAANDEKTLTFWQYLRLQNFANEQYGESHIYAGYGKHVVKPVGLDETRQTLIERFEQVPVRKTYTCDLVQFGYLDEPQKKLRVPMHYVLLNDAKHGLGKSPLPYGKVRIFQDDGRGTTAFLGEDWGAFTPLDDEMRLYLGVAQDIVVKRTIESNDTKKVAGNLYDYEIVVKYEIENFKNQPVTLDVAENIVNLRAERIGHRDRDVQWELGPKTTFAGGPDKEKSTVERPLFHADLPAAVDGKADKIVHKLHILIRNEW